MESLESSVSFDRLMDYPEFGVDLDFLNGHDHDDIFGLVNEGI